MLSCITIKRMNMASVFHAAVFLQVWNQNCLRYFCLSYLCYMSISLILPRLFVLILVYKPKAAKYAALIFVIFTILFVFSHIQIISSAFRSQTSLNNVNPLKPELNPICYLLAALLGARHFLHVSRIRVKLLTFRLIMSYIYGAPILDVSRSHTTTQHSR